MINHEINNTLDNSILDHNLDQSDPINSEDVLDYEYISKYFSQCPNPTNLTRDDDSIIVEDDPSLNGPIE